LLEIILSRKLSDPWGQFYQHFLTTFSRERDEKLFFGEWCLANGAQIWQPDTSLGTGAQTLDHK